MIIKEMQTAREFTAFLQRTGRLTNAKGHFDISTWSQTNQNSVNQLHEYIVKIVQCVKLHKLIIELGMETIKP